MDASAGASALGAVITTYPNLDPDRLGAKLRAAADHADRNLSKARTGTVLLSEKLGRYKHLTEQVGQQLAEAKEAVAVAETQRAAADAALKQFEEATR